MIITLRIFMYILGFGIVFSFYDMYLTRGTWNQTVNNFFLQDQPIANPLCGTSMWWEGPPISGSGKLFGVFDFRYNTADSGLVSFVIFSLFWSSIILAFRNTWKKIDEIYISFVILISLIISTSYMIHFNLYLRSVVRRLHERWPNFDFSGDGFCITNSHGISVKFFNRTIDVTSQDPAILVLSLVIFYAFLWFFSNKKKQL